MKLFITTVATALCSLFILHAQAQQLPAFPELKVKEDYAASESLVKEVADWLEETDLDEQHELRRKASAFIFDWVSGSPTVNIELTKYFGEVIEKNPPLYIIYMARYASYCITNKDNTDSMVPTKAGLAAMAKVYKKNIGVKKNKTMEKLVLAVDQNQLDDYIAKYMKAGFKK